MRPTNKSMVASGHRKMKKEGGISKGYKKRQEVIEEEGEDSRIGRYMPNVVNYYHN